MQAGDRIELVAIDDQWTKLAPGDQGMITGFGVVPGRLTGTGRDQKQIHVRWDDGSTLSLLEGVDQFKVIAAV